MVQRTSPTSSSGLKLRMNDAVCSLSVTTSTPGSAALCAGAHVHALQMQQSRSARGTGLRDVAIMCVCFTPLRYPVAAWRIQVVVIDEHRDVRFTSNEFTIVRATISARSAVLASIHGGIMKNILTSVVFAFSLQGLSACADDPSPTKYEDDGTGGAADGTGGSSPLGDGGGVYPVGA